MMGTISPSEVLNIAANLDGLNKQLDETLKQTQARVQSLMNNWAGQAATATSDAYNSFANKYFQNYHDLLDNYVKFLRKNVSEGYEQVETHNAKLSDLLK